MFLFNIGTYWEKATNSEGKAVGPKFELPLWHARLESINRKFRVPRKQGAHFLGAWAQIQDWGFSTSV
jgi:hypothetical protein